MNHPEGACSLPTRKGKEREKEKEKGKGSEGCKRVEGEGKGGARERLDCAGKGEEDTLLQSNAERQRRNTRKDKEE